MEQVRRIQTNDFLLLSEIEEGLKMKSDEEIIKLCATALKSVTNNTIKTKLEVILLLLL